MPGTTDPFEQATSAATENIHAALSATDHPAASTAEAKSPEPPAALPAAADTAGHGTMLLRGRTARSEPAAAVAVGHGTIRLHDPTASREANADDAVGHGTIRLHGWTAPPEPGLLHAIAAPTQHEDPITVAARADILAAIYATA